MKRILFGSAALALVLGGGAAQAAPKHAKHSRAHAATESSVQVELRELRAQVQALQSRLDAQQVAQRETATQVQTASAAAASAQSSAQSAQVAAATASSRIERLPDVVATQVAAIKPKTDKIYYKGVSVTLGGFLEAASIYRDHTLGADISSSFNAIPYDNVRAGHADETRFSARQSRLSALVQGDVNPHVHLGMYGEFDFQAAAQTANSNESNSYNPRIRHLYGTVDWDDVADQGYGLHFLAGQNWSLVTMNTKGITPRNELTPPQIDAQYVPGFAWARQPQFRVTGDFLNHSLWAAVSAENPQTTFFTTGTPVGATPGSVGTAATVPSTFNIAGGSGFNSANTLSLTHVPDLVAKVAYEWKPMGHSVHLEGFGLFKAFYDRRNNTQSDNVYGGGGGFGVVAQIIPDKLDAQVSGLFGKGIGRYGSSQLPDATFRSDGRIEPITEAMFLAGGTFHATKMLDIYAFGGEEHSDRQAYTTANGLAYGYGNPLYTNAGCEIEGSTACNGNTKLIEQGTLGFWQKLYQGPFGRIQFGVQYSYTERHGYSGVGGAPEQDENMVFTSFRYYPF